MLRTIDIDQIEQVCREWDKLAESKAGEAARVQGDVEHSAYCRGEASALRAASAIVKDKLGIK